MPVLYDPDRPGDARIDSLANRTLGPAICGGIGAVFTALGSVFLIRARRRAKHAAWLRVRGRERWVEVDHIDQNSGIRLNGRCPFVVHASWVDEQTGRTHTARSEHLWKHPGPDLMAQRVRVLFDPADPHRNLIDLTRAGLLSRINLGDNVWRFELRGPNKALHPEHPHFVCTQCGEVTCLSQVRVKLTPAPGSTKSVVSSISEIVIKGQCTQCG